MYFPLIPKKNTAVYSVLVRDEIVQPDGQSRESNFKTFAAPTEKLSVRESGIFTESWNWEKVKQESIHAARRTAAN